MSMTWAAGFLGCGVFAACDRFIAFAIDAVLLAGAWTALCMVVKGARYHTILDPSRWQGTVE